MNKKVIAAVILVVVAVIGFFAFQKYSSSIHKQEGGDTNQSQTTNPQPQQITATTKEVVDENKNLNYKGELHYPEFSGIASVDAQTAINVDIKKSAMDAYTDFKKELNCKPMAGDPISDNPCEFISSSQSFQGVGGKILSVQMEYYQYTQGAHGNTAIAFLNYDLATGKRITWQSVFTNSSKTLQLIADYSRQELSAREVEGNKVINDQDWLKTGTDPGVADNYQNNVGFASDGLLVIFQQYQVTAYVYGPQLVKIPYANLAAVINKNGLLGGVAQ